MQAVGSRTSLPTLYGRESRRHRGRGHRAIHGTRLKTRNCSVWFRKPGRPWIGRRLRTHCRGEVHISAAVTGGLLLTRQSRRDRGVLKKTSFFCNFTKRSAAPGSRSARALPAGLTSSVETIGAMSLTHRSKRNRGRLKMIVIWPSYRMSSGARGYRLASECPVALKTSIETVL